MSNIKPLPCPFCWETPDCLPGSDNPDTTCLTVDCIMHENTQPLNAWNYRTPHSPAAAANERHPHADVARLCIVNARRRLNVVSTISSVDSCHLTSADRSLRQALDALRPPTAPVSAVFWLGREAS